MFPCISQLKYSWQILSLYHPNPPSLEGKYKNMFQMGKAPSAPLPVNNLHFNLTLSWGIIGLNTEFPLVYAEQKIQFAISRVSADKYSPDTKQMLWLCACEQDASYHCTFSQRIAPLIFVLEIQTFKCGKSNHQGNALSQRSHGLHI